MTPKAMFVVASGDMESTRKFKNLENFQSATALVKATVKYFCGRLTYGVEWGRQ